MNTIIGCGLFILGMIAFTGWMIVRGSRDDDEGYSGTGSDTGFIRDDRGWTYFRDDVRERYESECG